MSSSFPFPLSERVEKIKPSLTLAITARAKALKEQGVPVLSFSAGEPDFSTPELICQAGIEAILSGKTKYTPEDGIPELKRAVIRKYEKDLGIPYSTEEVIVSVGAKQAIFNLLMAVLNPGDEVLIFSPYWVSYPEMVLMCGGEPKIVPTYIEEGFQIPKERVLKAITSRTRGILLNSPSNPTGRILSREELLFLAKIIREHRLWAISDEIYDRLVYADSEVPSLLKLDPSLKDQVAVVNGVSKTYAMTGWRIGYAVGPREWIRAASKVQSQSTSNPTSISQYAAWKALESGETLVNGMVEKFRERRNCMLTLLKELPGVKVYPAEGAFYLFPQVEEWLKIKKIPDTFSLAEAILQEAHVALVPGEGFGAPGYLRFSYAVSVEMIEEGIRRIQNFLSR